MISIFVSRSRQENTSISCMLEDGSVHEVERKENVSRRLSNEIYCCFNFKDRKWEFYAADHSKATCPAIFKDDLIVELLNSGLDLSLVA